MPELPEVETIARGLGKRVRGDVIESVWLGSKPEPLKSAAGEIAATLEAARIARVRRVGKHIVFDLEAQRRAPAKLARARARLKKPATLRSARTGGGARPHVGRSDGRDPISDGAQWIVHLGMTGQLLVCSPEEELEKHTHAVLKLASGRELRFVDPRRFGRLSVVRNGGFVAAGTEPLDIAVGRFI